MAKKATSKKKTVGNHAIDALQSNTGPVTVIDQQRAMQENYLKELISCAQQHKSIFPGNFYVVVITKTEPLMPNVIRNYFFARISCPTPDYDQSVFKYDHRKEELEYLWTIPSKDACIYLKENALLVNDEEKQSLEFVLAFADGSLFRLSKKLNKEDAVYG